MNLQDTYTFTAPAKKLWGYILAGDMIAALIPGCTGLNRVAPDEFTAQISIDVFLFKTTLTARVKMLEQVEPEFCRFFAGLTGKMGEAYIEGSFKLKEDADTTVLTYEAAIELHGKLDTFGHKIIEKSAAGEIREGLQQIELELQKN